MVSVMKYENIPINENYLINEDSEVIYTSSIGVGSDNEEVRLILFDKRLISDGKNMKIINESDVQIVLTKSSAIKLRNLLNEQIE